MYLHTNPLTYTDYDEFPRDTESFEAFLARRASRAKNKEGRERSLRRMRQEWNRIYNSIMSPAAREKAIARMENTRHDINLIVYSGEQRGEDTSLRSRERRFASSMKPNAINLIVDARALRSIAIGGINAATSEMQRSRRESIYTAHTLLHRIGDDFPPAFWPERRGGLINEVVTASTLAPYMGRQYRTVLMEMVRRVAGAYLADQRRRVLFTGDGENTKSAVIDRAAAEIAKRVSLPVALLAFDPAVVRYFTVSGLERFGRRVGEEPAAALRMRREEEALGESLRPYDPVVAMRRDVSYVFDLIISALWYSAGTTWMSRMDLASAPSQVLADTFAQTEIYGGTKFEIGHEFGRTLPRSESKRPPLELPEPLVREVNAALVPVARAFDDYNNAVLDYLVGRLTDI